MAGLVSSDTLGPGESAQIAVALDPAGKTGKVRKQLKLVTNDPERPILNVPVLAQIDHTLDVDPAEPLEVTLFSRPECAKCHARPAKNLTSGPLYDAICAMCHGPIAEYASGLPRDLMAEARMRPWVAEGLGANGMPGYATARGGPLSDEQIDSLVELMLEEGR